MKGLPAKKISELVRNASLIQMNIVEELNKKNLVPNGLQETKEKELLPPLKKTFPSKNQSKNQGGKLELSAKPKIESQELMLLISKNQESINELKKYEGASELALLKKIKNTDEIISEFRKIILKNCSPEENNLDKGELLSFIEKSGKLLKELLDKGVITQAGLISCLLPVPTVLNALQGNPAAENKYREIIENLLEKDHYIHFITSSLEKMDSTSKEEVSKDELFLRKDVKNNDGLPFCDAGYRARYLLTLLPLLPKDKNAESTGDISKFMVEKKKDFANQLIVNIQSRKGYVPQPDEFKTNENGEFNNEEFGKYLNNEWKKVEEKYVLKFKENSRKVKEGLENLTNECKDTFILENIGKFTDYESILLKILSPPDEIAKNKNILNLMKNMMGMHSGSEIINKLALDIFNQASYSVQSDIKIIASSILVTLLNTQKIKKCAEVLKMMPQPVRAEIILQNKELILQVAGQVKPDEVEEMINLIRTAVAVNQGANFLNIVTLIAQCREFLSGNDR